MPTDYRLSPGIEEDSKRRHIYVPKNIADYEPGHSSISEREKQMVSITEISIVVYFCCFEWFSANVLHFAFDYFY